MTSGSEGLLEVGRVVGTHGLRGDLKVRMIDLQPEELLKADRVYLHRTGGEPEPLTPLRQSLHKGNVLLRLPGFESLTAVEPLVGSMILLAKEDLPELGDGRYRIHELVGLQVVDGRLGPVGRLIDIFTTAAHDTYVVEGDAGEVLIPAVPEIVTDIDLDEQIMKVDMPEGLVSINR